MKHEITGCHMGVMSQFVKRTPAEYNFLDCRKKHISHRTGQTVSQPSKWPTPICLHRQTSNKKTIAVKTKIDLYLL